MSNVQKPKQDVKQVADVIWPKARPADTVHVPVAWDVAEPPGSWWLTVKIEPGSRGFLIPETGAAQVAQLIKRRASYHFRMALIRELGGVSDG